MKPRSRRRPQSRALPKPTAPTGSSWLDQLFADLDRQAADERKEPIND